MKIYFPLLFTFFLINTLHAQRVSGIVRDNKGNILANASINIRGTLNGTTSNNDGEYFLNLSPGSYTLVAQYVGCKKDIRNITLGNQDINLDFELEVINFELEEVVVRSGDNPANDIIKKTIEKRPFYQNQLDKFRCEVYSKGILKLRDYPKKVLGKKLDFVDGDTSKEKIVYLSETVSTYSVDKPNNSKIEVRSSKVSGNGDGYGLSAPQFYSIYNNNISIGTNLNPRGFISPIADNAQRYYRYKYEGAFFEDGKQINKIRVIPKRKFEPLFSGFINIVENEWRIHSLKLLLTRESQMEFLDTLQIEQIYFPAEKDVWVIQSQVIYPTAKIFGVDGYGSFINIYSKFEVDPDFPKKYFNNTILVYNDTSRRKTDAFWEDNRPVKLLDEEIRDYRRKDSIEQLSKNPAFLDSVDRVHNKITLLGATVLGMDFNKEKRNATYHIRSISELVSYNVVEGLTLNLGFTLTKRLDSVIGRRSISITPNVRYGFSNHHFNSHLTTTYTYGKKYAKSISLSGGKRVYQFNNASPIGARGNSLSSLFGEKNTMKLYEAYYINGAYTEGIGKGFTWSIGFQYQDRLPLENTTDFSFFDKKNRDFTPNYPSELVTENFKRHQALSTNFTLTFQPGARYIQLPDQKINIGSKWPVMSVGFTKGISGFLGSDVDYAKWRFTVSDLVRFKMLGIFNYRIGFGGFLSAKKVEIPDYHHFNGNISKFATAYLNSFQLLPIYQYSNTRKFYSLAHIEQHLNGFLTNKIPGFRRLNWYLVGGANMFYIDKNTRYFEVMAGFENIFKILRIDYVRSYFNGKFIESNFRIGLRGRLPRSEE